MTDDAGSSDEDRADLDDSIAKLQVRSMPGPLKCVWAVPRVARSAGSGGGGGRRCTESSNGAARLVPPLPADGEDNEIASRPGFTLNLPANVLLIGVWAGSAGNASAAASPEKGERPRPCEPGENFSSFA